MLNEEIYEVIEKLSQIERVDVNIDVRLKEPKDGSPVDYEIKSSDVTCDDVFEMMTDIETLAYDLVEQVALGGDDYVVPHNVHTAESASVEVFDEYDIEVAIGAIVAFESAVAKYVTVFNLTNGIKTEHSNELIEGVTEDLSEAIEWILLVSRRISYLILKAKAEADVRRGGELTEPALDCIEWSSNALEGVEDEMLAHMLYYGYDIDDDYDEDEGS